MKQMPDGESADHEDVKHEHRKKQADKTENDEGDNLSSADGRVLPKFESNHIPNLGEFIWRKCHERVKPIDQPNGSPFFD
jgi:hypothetical protein